MKMFRSLILTLTALATLAITADLQAAAAKPTPFVPHHTLIGSISATQITINTFTSSKTYKINKDTVITYQGNTVTTADLKPGMKVSITAGTDPDVAATITASPPPKAVASATPKKG